MEEEKRREPIQVPASDKKREVGRALIEGAASLVPGGGAVSRILRTTHPPQSEQDRKEWQLAVSERTNEHSERLDKHEALLDPKATLEGASAALALILIQNCPNGLGATHYNLEELCALLHDVERDSVEDAVHDLNHFGILNVHYTLGGWTATLTPNAYEQLDPQVMRWDTIRDAASIAEIMLHHKTGHAPDLEELTGWSRRRFNPAFRFVLQVFPEGRIRRVLQSEYPSLGVAIAPEDRVNLRRFIKSVSEPSA